MCRLFAMIGATPLPIQEGLAAFYPLCSEGCVKTGMTGGHLDGWGVAGYSNGRAVYFGRQARPATEALDDYKRAGERAVKSGAPVVLAHFRKTSGSEIDISNTHPFLYQDWAFAHNGTIFDAAKTIPPISSSPQGTTDSERFFLWLWEQVHAETDTTQALVSMLKNARESLSFSALNFLLSDGKSLWAYCDVGTKHFDEGETPEEREKYYTLYWSSIAGGAMVSSEPLKTLSDTWNPLPKKTLAIFSQNTKPPRLLTF